MSRNALLVGTAVIAILVTGVVLSQFASDQPDGLEYVAEQQGFDETARDHTLDESPLAGYGESSVAGTAIAAVVGIVVTGAIGFVMFWFVRRKPDLPTVP